MLNVRLATKMLPFFDLIRFSLFLLPIIILLSYQSASSLTMGNCGSKPVTDNRSRYEVPAPRQGKPTEPEGTSQKAGPEREDSSTIPITNAPTEPIPSSPVPAVSLRNIDRNSINRKSQTDENKLGSDYLNDSMVSKVCHHFFPKCSLSHLLFLFPCRHLGHPSTLFLHVV